MNLVSLNQGDLIQYKHIISRDNISQIALVLLTKKDYNFGLIITLINSQNFIEVLPYTLIEFKVIQRL